MVRDMVKTKCDLIFANGTPAAMLVKAHAAQLPGWSTATVHVMHSRWAKQGEAMFELRGCGGRGHQHLTPARENE